MDLDKANAAGVVTWSLGYTATSLYGIPDVTPSSMEALINKMTNISSVEFSAYVNWYNTNGEKNFPCDNNCHKDVMCGLRNVEDETFHRCLASPNVSMVGILLHETLKFTIDTIECIGTLSELNYKYIHM